jgi:RimJ/RimL family protein N-acetyltransferase
VVAAHRGRGLARHIKLESLRRLAADRPDVRAVITGNDITNTPMLAVNTALGFIEMGIQTDAFLLFADAR